MRDEAQGLYSPQERAPVDNGEKEEVRVSVEGKGKKS